MHIYRFGVSRSLQVWVVTPAHFAACVRITLVIPLPNKLVQLMAGNRAAADNTACCMPYATSMPVLPHGSTYGSTHLQNQSHLIGKHHKASLLVCLRQRRSGGT